nr:unnamed protein product [Naegleria fowleri]
MKPQHPFSPLETESFEFSENEDDDLISSEDFTLPQKNHPRDSAKSQNKRTLYYLILVVLFLVTAVTPVSIFYIFSNYQQTLQQQQTTILQNNEKSSEQPSEQNNSQSQKEISSFWTKMDQFYSKSDFEKANEIIRPLEKHSKLFSKKTITCFSTQHAVTCGLTNQLFEIINCLALAAKLGVKKVILPSSCVDGNWGLCHCDVPQPFSKLFDLDRMRKYAMERFGLDVDEFEHVSPTTFAGSKISEPLIKMDDRTNDMKEIEQAAEVIYTFATNRTDYLNHEVLNLGFVWGRWQPRSIPEELLYVQFFDLFAPSQAVYKIVEEWKWKVRSFDSGEPNGFTVVHYQYEFFPGFYPGCERSEFKPNEFLELLVNELKIKRDSSVLLIGTGFEQFSPQKDLRSVEIAQNGIALHLQSELLSQSKNHQLHSAAISFWLALDADFFVGTSCESQFVSHLLRIRTIMKKSTCARYDVRKTIYPWRYPEKYLNATYADVNFSDVPYFFPAHNQGKVFFAEKCSHFIK